MTNTAFISTTSNDTVTNNNQSSATITVSATNTNPPITPVTPVKPAPNNPVGMSIGGSDVLFQGRRALTTVRCTGPCSGVARLYSVRAVKAGRKKVRRGALLGWARFRYNSAGKRKLALRLNGSGRIVLRRGGRAVLKLSSGEKRVVRIRR